MAIGRRGSRPPVCDASPTIAAPSGTVHGDPEMLSDRIGISMASQKHVSSLSA